MRIGKKILFYLVIRQKALNILIQKHLYNTMKFYVVVNYYFVNLSFKLYENPCINACARVVNAHAHDLSRVHAFMTRVRASMHGSS